MGRRALSSVRASRSRPRHIRGYGQSMTDDRDWVDRDGAGGEATESMSSDHSASQTPNDGGSEGATDPRATLGRALDQAGMVIARITPDQVKHATPCQSWDVGTVANHLINGVDRFRRTVAGETV